MANSIAVKEFPPIWKKSSSGLICLPFKISVIIFITLTNKGLSLLISLTDVDLFSTILSKYFRSTFPLEVKGNCDKDSIVLGTIYEGNLFVSCFKT